MKSTLRRMIRAQPVTLKDVIAKIGILPKVLNITYRTYTPDGWDVFAGSCEYYQETGELIAKDGDDYYLDDPVMEYEIGYNDGEKYLTVWYESEWING